MNARNGFSFELGKYQKEFDARLKRMQEQDFSQRLWDKDKNLWKGTEISMGWLNVVDKMRNALPAIEEFCNTIRSSGFSHVVLLGMGGSSLAPLVFQKTFLNSNGIKLIVLDSTDPATVRKVESEISISKTLFIVSSKSGTTAEVLAFYDYFFSKLYLIKEKKTGENFVAITDEDSPLVELAIAKGFRKIFINFPDIGGRYSALSYFGIVPAALMGINVKELLDRTLWMVNACGPQVPVSKNPGIALGIAIAELASLGCDKLTYLLPPELSALGLWIEQLLAESTGKNSKGILPVKGDPLGEKDTYGKDCFFMQLEFFGKHDNNQSKKLEDLISANYPVINILIKDEMDLGQEFFRWEIATATAGAILSINPFDQPNVQESKKYTDRLLKKIEHYGKFPEITPILTEETLNYYTSEKISDYNLYKEYFEKGVESAGGKLLLEKFFHLINPGDYVALQAYLPEEPAIEKSIADIQRCLQKSLHIPVISEFGPRYLHSTGQYHKGGPNNGIFIQFIYDSPADIQIPERSYTFGMLKRAQAFGDMEALIQHDRRVILIDLGKDFVKGIDLFKQVIEKVQGILYNEYAVKEQYVNQAVTISNSNKIGKLNLN